MTGLPEWFEFSRQKSFFGVSTKLSKLLLTIFDNFLRKIQNLIKIYLIIFGTKIQIQIFFSFWKLNFNTLLDFLIECPHFQIGKKYSVGHSYLYHSHCYRRWRIFRVTREKMLPSSWTIFHSIKVKFRKKWV